MIANDLFSQLAKLSPRDYEPDPVSTVLCVVRRFVGKAVAASGLCHRSAFARMTRHDGAYLCFDLPDGSVFALQRRVEDVRVDRTGTPWPWVMAVEDRAGWEVFMRTDRSPAEWLVDCFCVSVMDEEAGQWAA